MSKQKDKPAGQGAQRPEQKKDWEQRVADRAEMAKKAGAHVMVPSSNMTRMIIQIAQQMDGLYLAMTQQSGLFGSVSNEKRLEIEMQLADCLTEMSLTAAKIAKTIGGRARYYHPRDLERFLKAHETARQKTQPSATSAKPANKSAQAMKPAAKTESAQEEKRSETVVEQETETAPPVKVARKATPPTEPVAVSA